MVRNILLASSCMLIALTCKANVSAIRAALDQYTNSVRRTAVRVSTIRNVGVSNVADAEYRHLCQSVSNDLAMVFNNPQQITTNDAERLVLMSVAWRYDENFYLNAYSILTDMALSNKACRAEIEWFGLPDRNDLANCIRRRYREPSVTNLAYKILQVTGDTNTYHEIVSGVSYTNYMEEVSAGLWQ